MNVLKININDVIGWWNGFWNLFMFLINGIVIKLIGIVVIERMFNSLFGIICNRLKVGKKYYLGRIFNGVVNGFVFFLSGVGFKIFRLI